MDVIGADTQGSIDASAGVDNQLRSGYPTRRSDGGHRRSGSCRPGIKIRLNHWRIYVEGKAGIVDEG
jgi:hypothetical protein